MSDRKNRVEPLNEPGPRRMLNSLWIVFVNNLIVKMDLLGITQNAGRMNNRNKVDLIQFIDNKIDEGSNEENRFEAIIFNLCYCFLGSLI
jgi:hypothetical protein